MDDDNDLNNTSPSEPDAMPQDDDQVASTLGTQHQVGDDISIEPDSELEGYQDDLGTGDKEDVVQEGYGTSPSDVTLMPEDVLKEELDGMALDEQPANPDDETRETTREHIEDMDENDKPRSEG